MDKNTKKCTVCKEEKSLDNFWKRRNSCDGHSSRCKKCHRIKHPRESLVSNENMKWCNKCKAEQSKTEFVKNKNRYDGLSGYCKHCQKQCINKRRKTEEYKQIRNETGRKYRQKNRLKILAWRRKYKKQKRAADPIWRLTENFRSAISTSLQGNKNGRHWENILGYTKQDLRFHLESQFQNGMTWDNYGQWHIDHKTPMSWFKFNSMEEDAFKKCWALENLQPKWAEENSSKCNRYAD